MSRNLLAADPTIRLRQGRLAASVGTAADDGIAALNAGQIACRDRAGDGVVPKQEAEAMIARLNIIGWA